MSKHADMPCGKVPYPTKSAVRRALGRYRQHWELYWCAPCGAFHVASRRRR